MNDAVLVALIGIGAAALSGSAAVWLTRKLTSAQVDDLVAKRLTIELERVYGRFDRVDAQAEAYRHNHGLLMDHIEALEQLVPPPPPPRPLLKPIPTNAT